MVFAISGIVNPERAQLRDEALSLGAKYRSDWTHDCTHLICAIGGTPKYDEAKDADGQIVTPDWIHDCYAQKKRLTESDFECPMPKPPASKKRTRPAGLNDNDDDDDNEEDVWNDQETDSDDVDVDVSRKSIIKTRAQRNPRAPRTSYRDYFSDDELGDDDTDLTKKSDVASQSQRNDDDHTKDKPREMKKKKKKSHSNDGSSQGTSATADKTDSSDVQPAKMQRDRDESADGPTSQPVSRPDKGDEELKQVSDDIAKIQKSLSDSSGIESFLDDVFASAIQCATENDAWRFYDDYKFDAPAPRGIRSALRLTNLAEIIEELLRQQKLYTDALKKVLKKQRKGEQATGPRDLLPSFLQDCFVFLDPGIDKTQLHRLTRLITAYAGVVQSRIEASTTHIILPFDQDSSVDSLLSRCSLSPKQKSQIKVVEAGWLEHCHKRQKRVPEQIFLVSE